MAFEVVEFRESSPQPGRPFKGSEQNVLGMFNSESEAIEQCRAHGERVRSRTRRM